MSAQNAFGANELCRRLSAQDQDRALRNYPRPMKRQPAPVKPLIQFRPVWFLYLMAAAFALVTAIHVAVAAPSKISNTLALYDQIEVLK